MKSGADGGMEDLIDKRNRKQKIAQSVVKRWNVHYMTEEEVRAQQTQMQGQSQEQVQPQGEEIPASEILERLQAEAEAGEAKKKAELERLIEQQEEEDARNYNPLTGAFSGAYGRQKVEDEATQEQIDAILGAKKEAFEEHLQKTLEENQNEP
ncbi:MAG: hypothetical protein K2O73_11430 [Lachnospiraceae bacterium]|nr:hypothetical protein [Lachnospiraceae bacterium]MDE7436732.1 hypothetical protein [Lachnospiraceae bacterium]